MIKEPFPARTENEDFLAILHKEIDEVPDWQELGACWNTMDESFFAPEFEGQLVAADTCYSKCPVRLQCLKAGLGLDKKRTPQGSGVWGGYTPDQRVMIRKRLKGIQPA